MEILKKENEDIKSRLLESERYRRRWSLRLIGKKEKLNENAREDVVKILKRIMPEMQEKIDDAVDVVHRMGKTMEGKHRHIIILFAKRNIRDDIWRRTKASSICKEEGIRLAEHLTREDWQSRQALWPKIDQARKEGKTAGFRGPYGFINGKRITG